MAGTKVSELNAATNLTANDLIYVVNTGNPTKSTLTVLGSYLANTAGFVKSINGVMPANGNLTLNANNINLGLVPNTLPVVSINTLKNNVTISSGTGLSVTNSTDTITIGVSDQFTLDFSKVSGPIANNPALATILANLGAQNPPRTITSSNTSLALLGSDVQVNWVDANFSTDTTLTIDAINASIGGVIEIRQGGLGKVNVAAASGFVILNQPLGALTQTVGVGTRIQLVSLGANAWEYR